MSGSAVKATRHAIRKAFGPEALESIAQQAAQTRQLYVEFQGLASHLETVKNSVFMQDEAVGHLKRLAWRRSLWGRLKWLVLGV